MPLAIYSLRRDAHILWVLDGFPGPRRLTKDERAQVRELGWQWAPGRRCKGAWFTRDESTALESARRLRLTVDEIKTEVLT